MFQENRLSFQGQFQLRTTGKPTAAAGPVQQIVRDVLKAAPITRVTTLADQVDSNIVPERLIATLSGCFGAIAVVLAGIGPYGLLAYTVTRRTNEIGVRMALGATTRDVNRLVLRDAFGILAAGLAVGVAMVVWSRPLAASVLTDLRSPSTIPIAFASAAILGAGLLAAYLPARRAARVDPMEALRHD